jgi:hypothetical protein
MYIALFLLPVAVPLFMRSPRHVALSGLPVGIALAVAWAWREKMPSTPTFNDTSGDFLPVALVVIIAAGFSVGVGLRLAAMGLEWGLRRMEPKA